MQPSERKQLLSWTPKINKVLPRWVGDASLIACEKPGGKEAFAKLIKLFFFTVCLDNDKIG